MKKAICCSICPSPERGIGFKAAYLTKSRELWTNHLLFSTGAMNTYRKANHRASAGFSRCFYVSIRIWVSGTTPVDKTLGNNVMQKNIGITRRIFLRTGDL
jgi:hypothetical protein